MLRSGIGQGQPAGAGRGQDAPRVDRRDEGGPARRARTPSRRPSSSPSIYTDAVITDIRMPPEFRLEGIELALRVRAEYPQTGWNPYSPATTTRSRARPVQGRVGAGLGYLLKERICRAGASDPRGARGIARRIPCMDPKVVDALVHRGSRRRGLVAPRARAPESDEHRVLVRRDGGPAGDPADRRRSRGEPGCSPSWPRPRAGGWKSRSRSSASCTACSYRRRRTRSRSPSTSHHRWRSPSSLKASLKPTNVEVSVVFTDIRGFTGLSEITEVATLGALLNEHLTAMSELVMAHEGIVDEFIGDAVMAVFGAPVALDGHARKAVECAQAMIARQDELNARWESEGHPPFGVGIGVNTGKAMAGAVGGAKLEDHRRRRRGERRAAPELAGRPARDRGQRGDRQRGGPALGRRRDGGP